MTDPYHSRDEPEPLQRSVGGWNSLSDGVYPPLAIAFVVVGVVALIAAAVFHDRAALLVGLAATLAGLSRLVLAWVQRRLWRR